MVDVRACQDPEYEGDKAGRGVQSPLCGKEMSARALLAVVGLGASGAPSQGPSPLRAEFHQDFRAGILSESFLRPYSLPRVPDDKGARFTLPADVDVLPHSGFSPNLTVRGDFEVTVSFEIPTRSRWRLWLAAAIAGLATALAFFQGAGCGKSLMARADLARKRLRCGRVVIAPTLLFAAVVGLGLIAGPARSADEGEQKSKTPVQDFFHQFKGNLQKPSGWELTGRDAEECVRFQPDGLRITLPAGRSGGGPGNGLSTGIVIKGDFEITTAFEILQEPQPADAGPRPTPLTLLAVLDRPEFTVAGLSRRVAATGQTEYTAWTSLKDRETGKPAGKFRAFPTTSRAGQLRLVRTGSQIAFYVSDAADGDFTFLQAYPFSDEDLKDARITAYTGGPKAALDARVTELRIRAAAPGNLPGTAPPSVATASPSRSRWKIWLAGAIIGLMVVLALGAWLYVRRGRRTRIAPVPAVPPGKTEPADKPESAAAIACRCPGCGKGFKARAQLAGRTVKCPQCGQGVLVLGIQGEGARHSPG